MSPEGRRKAISFLGWTGGACAGRAPIPEGRAGPREGCGGLLHCGGRQSSMAHSAAAWWQVTLEFRRLHWLHVAHSDQQIFRGGCREGCRPWPWGWGGCRGAFLVSNSWPKRLWQCPGAGRPSLQGHQASWAGQAGQAAVQSRTQAGVCAHFISITVGTFARVSLRSGASLSTEFFFEG